jgi:hypothetical protein
VPYCVGRARDWRQDGLGEIAIEQGGAELAVHLRRRAVLQRTLPLPNGQCPSRGYMAPEFVLSTGAAASFFIEMKLLVEILGDGTHFPCLSI